MKNLQQHSETTNEQSAVQPAQQHPVTPHLHRSGPEKERLVRSHHDRGIVARKQAGRRFNRHREENDGVDFLL